MKPQTPVLVLLSLLGLRAAAWLFGGSFRSTEVCNRCGATQHIRRVMWIPFRETRQTPLSDYLRSLEGAAFHSHRWLFAAGGGGLVRCALGEGRALFPVIRSEETVLALKSIRQHRGEAEAAIWTARLLDPKICHEARMALYWVSDSKGDFDSAFQDATEEFQVSQGSR
ncbi:MAG: hypothetical protein V4689_22490 [Verrucomicrobiota bacterium]